MLDQRLLGILEKSKKDSPPDSKLLKNIELLLGKEKTKKEYFEDSNQKKRILGKLSNDFEIEFKLGQGDKFWEAKKTMLEPDTDNRLRYFISLWIHSPHIGTSI